MADDLTSVAINDELFPWWEARNESRLSIETVLRALSRKRRTRMEIRVTIAAHEYKEEK